MLAGTNIGAHLGGQQEVFSLFGTAFSSGLARGASLAGLPTALNCCAVTR